jgi:hypothetical protein
VGEHFLSHRGFRRPSAPAFHPSPYPCSPPPAPSRAWTPRWQATPRLPPWSPTLPDFGDGSDYSTTLKANEIKGRPPQAPILRNQPPNHNTNNKKPLGKVKRSPRTGSSD